MFVSFFLALRDAKVPVTLREYLTLLEAVRAGVAGFDVEGFYFVARAALVKDERWFDRFDRVFADHFGALATGIGVVPKELPEEWLRRLSERVLTEEEKALVQAMGGWDKLMEELAKRLAEQRERHEGGSRWIGTAGTSPFGAFGYNPEGVRIGQGSSRHRSAVAVWDRREFQDLDDDVEIGVRGMKMALRRLREFVREGAPDELDVDGTIDATARNAGLLDVKMRPERRNRARVLLLLDVGGSMDDHVTAASQLFSAARAEFAGLEPFYFHNCVYDRVWRSNGDRVVDVVPTEQVLRTYGRNWKLVVVGDASMSPYELTVPGGGIEQAAAESGETWLRRLVEHYPRAAWINPIAEPRWGWTGTIGAIRAIFGGRMYPLTLAGLGRAMSDLAGRRRAVGGVVAALLAFGTLGGAAVAARAEEPAVVVRVEGENELRARLRALSDANDHAALVAACDEVLARAPASVPALEFRAWALHASLRLDDAERAYDALVAAAPKSAWAWFGKARLASDRGRFSDAVAAAERSVAAKPSDEGAWHELVRARRGLGDFAGARAALLRAEKAGIAAGWRLLEGARLEWAAGDAAAAAELLADVERTGPAPEVVAELRRLVETEAKLAPEDRARRAAGHRWIVGVGAVAVETTVGPELPGEVRSGIEAAQSVFAKLLALPEGTKLDVRVVLSRTVDEHEVHRREHLPFAHVGIPWTQQEDTGGTRVFLAWERPSPARNLAHELAHALLRARGVTSPWIHEGVAEYLEDHPGAKALGVVEPRRLDVLLAAKDAGRLPPWDQVPALGHVEFAAGALLHYARAWLVVHYALHAPDGPGLAGFHRLLEVREPEAVPAALGRKSWHELAQALDRHLERLAAGSRPAARDAAEPGADTLERTPGADLVRHGRYAAAVKVLEGDVGREPTSQRAWDQLVLAYCALGQHDDAREALLRARRSGIDATWCAMRTVLVACEAGDLDGAADAYRECQRQGGDASLLAMLRRVIETEREVSPEERAERDPAAPWKLRRGFFDVETTVAPWMPEVVEDVLVRVSAELPGLVGISQPGSFVEVVISRTRHEHEKLWWDHFPAGHAPRGGFAWDAGGGRVRCHVSWLEDDLERTIAHEVTHCFLHLRAPRAPNWLHEGLSQHVAALVTGNAGGREAPRLAHLRKVRERGELIPWREVPTLPWARFAADDCLREYSQSWVLVHWLLHGRDAPGRAAFPRLVRAALDGKPPGPSFQEAVGRPWEQIETALDAHLAHLVGAR